MEPNQALPASNQGGEREQNASNQNPSRPSHTPVRTRSNLSIDLEHERLQWSSIRFGQPESLSNNIPRKRINIDNISFLQRRTRSQIPSEGFRLDMVNLDIPLRDSGNIIQATVQARDTDDHPSQKDNEE